MSFHHSYLVDPQTGLNIQIKNFKSMAGRGILHDVGVATITMPVESENSPTGALAMYQWMHSGAGSTVVRTLKVYTIDDSDPDNPQDIETETFYLNAAQIDYGSNAGDTYITFTGYYCAGRLKRADLPYLLPGEPPYLVLPEDTDGNILPVTADQVVRMVLDKIKSNGNLGDVELVVSGNLPLIVLENKPGSTFLDFLNQLVSSKSLTWRFSEGRTGARLTIYPWFEAGQPRNIEFNLGSVTEAVQSQISAENLITRLTVVSKNGQIWRGSNAATESALGYIVDKSVPRTDLYTQAMTDDWGIRTLEQESSTVPSFSCKSSTNFLPNLWVLGRDFEIGDTVSVFFDGENRYRLRVESCDKVVTDSGNQLGYSNLQLGRSPREIIPIKGTDPNATTAKPEEPKQPDTTNPTNPDDGGDDGGFGEGAPDSLLSYSSDGKSLGSSGLFAHDSGVLSATSVRLAPQGVLTFEGGEGASSSGQFTDRPISIAPGSTNEGGYNRSLIVGNGSDGQDVAGQAAVEMHIDEVSLVAGNKTWATDNLTGTGGPVLVGGALYYLRGLIDSLQSDIGQLKNRVDAIEAGGGTGGGGVGTFAINPTSVTRGQDTTMTVSGWQVPNGTGFRYYVNSQVSSETVVGTIVAGSATFTLKDRDFAAVSSSSFFMVLEANDATQSPTVAISVTAGSGDGGVELQISPNTATAGQTALFMVTTNHSDGTVFVPYWSGQRIDSAAATVGSGVAYIAIPASYVVGSGPTLLDIDISGVFHTGITVTVAPDPDGRSAGGSF